MLIHELKLCQNAEYNENSSSKTVEVPEPRSARGDCKTRVEQSSACGAVGIATLPNIVAEEYDYTE